MKTDITVLAKRKFGLWFLYGIPLLLLSLLATNVLNAQCTSIQNFSGATTIAATQTAGAWYPDRFAPAGFTSPANEASPIGAGRLKHSINASNHQSNAFYNTQGRKLDLADGAYLVEVDLYIDPNWAATPKRWAGLWASEFSEAGVSTGKFPIIEYTTATEGPNSGPRFRGYNHGTWIEMGNITTNFEGWVTLRIRRLANGQYTYLVAPVAGGGGNLFFTTTAYTGSVGGEKIGEAILQGHNNTATTSTGFSYDIYWDNFEYKTPLLTATVAAASSSAGCGASAVFNIEATPNTTVNYTLTEQRNRWLYLLLVVQMLL